MKIANSTEMRLIDSMTTERYGLGSLVLMERAGVAVAEIVETAFEGRKALVLAGGGNNGADGLVVARELKNKGWRVKAIILADADRLSADCVHQLDTVKAFGVDVSFGKKVSTKDVHGAVIIDAIFGTGLSRPIEGAIKKVIDFVNGLTDSKIVSVDMPSGVSADTGEVMGSAVMADYTVTFGLPKRGHLLYPGAEHSGSLFIENIGFPRALLEDESIKAETIEQDNIVIPARKQYSNKSTYGHLFLVGGSRGKTGAVMMSARSALKSGVGLLTVCVPESIISAFEKKAIEEMTLPLPDSEGKLSDSALDGILGLLKKKSDVLAIGPGMGASNETRKLMKGLLNRFEQTMVIDADGINSLDIESIEKAVCQVVITPHPGEMSKLTGISIAEIEANRIGTALDFSAKTDAVLVLKGVPTIVAHRGRAFVNTTGNPGMAKAGSGDVLTGMISALIAQGMTPLEASKTGVFLHGRSGDIAVGKKGIYSTIASDIINSIPDAFRSMEAQ